MEDKAVKRKVVGFEKGYKSSKMENGSIDDKLQKKYRCV